MMRNKELWDEQFHQLEELQRVHEELEAIEHGNQVALFPLLSPHGETRKSFPSSRGRKGALERFLRTRERQSGVMERYRCGKPLSNGKTPSTARLATLEEAIAMAHAVLGNEREPATKGRELKAETKEVDLSCEDRSPIWNNKPGYANVGSAPIMFTSLSKQLRKRIQRLPRPNEQEQQRLREISMMFYRYDETSEARLYDALSKPRRNLDDQPPEMEANQSELIDVPLNEKRMLLPDVGPRLRLQRQERGNRTKGPEIGGECSKADLDLHEQLEKSKTILKHHDEAIAALMETSKEMVPEEYRFRRKFELGLEKEMTDPKDVNHVHRFLLRVLVRLHHKVLYTYWTRWLDAVETKCEWEQNLSARRVQQWWFAIQARTEMQVRMEQLGIQRERMEASLRAIIRKRCGSALLIQKMARGKIAKEVLRVKRQMIAAAIRVQSTWRMRQGRTVFLGLQVLRERRKRGATIIQSMVRSSLAYRRLVLLRKIRSVERKQAEQEREKARREAKFERLGAAAIVQMWWRALQLRLRTKAMVRLRKRRMAITLQNWWRIMVAKHRLREMLEERRQRAERESKAALALQRHFRARHARKLVEATRQDMERRRKERLLKREVKQRDRTIELLGRTLNITKRRRKFHELRKKYDPLNSKREHRAATKIQKSFRGYRARKRVKTMRTKRDDAIRKLRREKARKAAIGLQSRWRARRDRRRVEVMKGNMMATRIQGKFRACRARKLAHQIKTRHRAARNIQRMWKRKMARIAIKTSGEQRKIHSAGALPMQRLARMYLARKHVASKREQRRVWAELHLRGSNETRVAINRESDRLLLKSAFASMDDPKICSRLDGALQDIAKHWGIKPNTREVEVGKHEIRVSGEKWARMVRDTPGFLRDRNEVDLLFAKHKDANQRSLDFIQFRNVLCALGRMCHQELETASDEEAILRICHDHFWKASWCKDIRKGWEERGRCRMEWASRKVQQRFRGVLARKIATTLKTQLEEERYFAHQNRAATFVQSLWRRRKARKQLVDALRKAIQKCIDPGTGDPFWFNTITGESSWEKPSLFGQEDVEHQVVLPTTDEEYTVNCVRCKVEPAMVLCLDCAVPCCHECHRGQHLKGSKSKHETQDVLPCGHCEYQVATRRCMSCLDLYCCTCFKNNHRIEPKSSHGWIPLVVQCFECEDRAARWRCFGCDGDFWCTPCFKEFHSNGKRRGHEFEALRYQTVELQRKEEDQERKRQINEHERKAREAREKRERELLEWAALRLQARWRGRKGRQAGKQFLKEERRKLRRAYNTKKKDDETRAKFSYALKRLVGVAPILETDDDETKKLKRMGWKGTVWGQAAVKRGLVVTLPPGEQLPGTASIARGETILRCAADLTKLVRKGDWLNINGDAYEIEEINKAPQHDKLFRTIIKLDYAFAKDTVEFVAISHLGRLALAQVKNVHVTRALREADIKNPVAELKAKAAMLSKEVKTIARKKLHLDQVARKATIAARVKLGINGLQKKMRGNGSHDGVVDVQEAPNSDEPIGDLSGTVETEGEELIEEAEEFEEKSPDPPHTSVEHEYWHPSSVELETNFNENQVENFEDNIVDSSQIHQQPMFGQWETYFDEQTQAYYYYNTFTGETTWDPPPWQG